ncbi:MAG: hypothetical protein ACRDH6_07670 [Actinomycetota bacterium]
MRRIVAIAVAGLLIVGLFGASAEAAKKKKKPKLVPTTLYMHGASPLGEVDNNPVTAEYMPMDSTEPSGGEAKSQQITQYGVGPNTECAGNNFFPVWVGDLSGQIAGDMKMTINVISNGGQVELRVWGDINSLLCNSAMSADYPTPDAAGLADLPAGQATVEATIGTLAPFTVSNLLMVQVSPIVPSTFVGRILYDSADAASALEFGCAPPKGQKTCTP